MVILNCLCGLLAFVATFFAKLDPFYSIVAALSLSSLVMLLLGRWLSGELQRPIEKVARLAQILERNTSASLPGTTGAVETDQILGSLRRISQQHQNLVAIADAASGLDAPSIAISAESSSEISPETEAEVQGSNAMPPDWRSFVRLAQDATLKIEFLAKMISETAGQISHDFFAYESQFSRIASLIPQIAGHFHEVTASADTFLAVADESIQNSRHAAETDPGHPNVMDRVRRQVHETAKRIKRLGERAQEIGQIVGQIGELSDQTSLVALNASLRAGSANSEIGVVAREVKRLAERSERLRQFITDLSHSVTAETGEAVASMEETIHEVVVASSMGEGAGRSITGAENFSARLTEPLRAMSETAQVHAAEAENIARETARISEISRSAQLGAEKALSTAQAIVESAAGLRDLLSGFGSPSEPTEIRKREAEESVFVN